MARGRQTARLYPNNSGTGTPRKQLERLRLSKEQITTRTGFGFWTPFNIFIVMAFFFFFWFYHPYSQKD